MRWSPLLRVLGRETILALILSGLFAYLGAVPWRVSAAILLFAGPGAGLLLERIRSGSGVRYVLAPAPRWFRWATVAWLAFIAALALAASFWEHIGYWKAFAWTWLIVAGSGAINALVAEWEDHRPGGFLNPRN